MIKTLNKFKIVFILLVFPFAVKADGVLYNFNEVEASDMNWPGWEWIGRNQQNPHLTTGSLGASGYSTPGWISTSGFMTQGSWYPRLSAKEDTGDRVGAIIDPNVRAPGTPNGGSMKVYDTPAGVITSGSVVVGSNIISVSNPAGYAVGDNIIMSGVTAYSRLSEVWYPQISAINGNQFTIVRSDTKVAYNSTTTVNDSDLRPLYLAGWFYLPGKNFSTLNLADETTNRMSMYVKVDGINSFIGNTDLYNTTFYIGTYLCWPGGGLGGEDCPKEANGGDDNHYYHYFTFNSGGWTHLLLDQSPQHNRGDAGSHIVPPDPRFVADGIHHYFQYMSTFYAQVSYPNLNPTSFWIDEMKFYTASQMENEISVASLFVSYWPGNDTWELGFNDNSWSDNLGNNAISTYEVRYATYPITNENFDSAVPITPMLNQKTGANAGEGRIKRPNSWKFSALTRFILSSEIVKNNNKIYFAVKDVSLAAKGDGHDAASPFIKTIDYDLRPQTDVKYSILNFVTLILNWFHFESGNTSDINFDNIVNAKDLGIMMSKWN